MNIVVTLVLTVVAIVLGKAVIDTNKGVAGDGDAAERTEKVFHSRSAIKVTAAVVLIVIFSSFFPVLEPLAVVAYCSFWLYFMAHLWWSFSRNACDVSPTTESQSV